jgi:hypothetical protein
MSRQKTVNDLSGTRSKHDETTELAGKFSSSKKIQIWTVWARVNFWKLFKICFLVRNSQENYILTRTILKISYQGAHLLEKFKNNAIDNFLWK